MKIPVRVVQLGMVRSAQYNVGDDVIEGGNAHCLVYVDEAWRIINQHWGSQSVLQAASAEWELVAGRRVGEHSGQEQVFVMTSFSLPA